MPLLPFLFQHCIHVRIEPVALDEAVMNKMSLPPHSDPFEKPPGTLVPNIRCRHNSVHAELNEAKSEDSRNGPCSQSAPGEARVKRKANFRLSIVYAGNG